MPATQQIAPVAQPTALVGESASQQPSLVATPVAQAEAQTVSVAKVPSEVTEVEAVAQAPVQTQAVDARGEAGRGETTTQVETQSQHTGLTALLLRVIGLAMMLGLIGMAAGVVVFGLVGRRRC